MCELCQVERCSGACVLFDYEDHTVSLKLSYQSSSYLFVAEKSQINWRWWGQKWCQNREETIKEKKKIQGQKITHFPILDHMSWCSSDNRTLNWEPMLRNVWEWATPHISSNSGHSGVRTLSQSNTHLKPINTILIKC